MAGQSARVPVRAPFLLALFVLLSLGLAGGVWSALAAESPSPDAGKVTPRPTWTEDVEDPQPVHRPWIVLRLLRGL
jgi:hypothetical protein